MGKQGSPSSRPQRIKAWLKRTLRGEEPFKAQLLDASSIRLDNAFLAPLVDLERIFMREASLNGAHLNRANLNGANLRRAYLSRAWLSEAHLNEADLTEADLTKASLCGADLSEAHLKGVNLSGADLRGVDLSEARLKEGVNLSGAKYNKKMMYERTHRIKPTQWPEEFDPQIEGLTCVDC